jgi:hypothetical protein
MVSFTARSLYPKGLPPSGLINSVIFYGMGTEVIMVENIPWRYCNTGFRWHYEFSLLPLQANALN